MNKRIIIGIIIIMTLSLIGVGVIQYYWVMKAVNLDEKNFNDKVTIALNNVKKKITIDTEKLLEQRFFEELGMPPPGKDGIINIQHELKIDSNDKIGKNQSNTPAFNIKSYNQDELLENIDNVFLDKTLRAELAFNNLDLQYEYGVYSHEFKSYFIENGSYTATIGDTSKSSNVANVNLLKAEFKIPLFDNESYSPGHLNLYFPRKKSFIWSNFVGILLSSTIFTGLILFCFIYTIWVIIFQKKISEIKTDFINNMTHEFKTPIATISLASDSILNPSILQNQDKVQRFIGIIKQENTRMLDLVEKILQMAQIEKKNVQLKYNEINIHDIIEDAIVNAELKIQTKGGQIITELNANDPYISADETHLASIINNLLDNAEKYTPEKPIIVIKTKNVKGGIQFSITDNGLGMSKEDVKMAFEKFYRAHTGNLHDVKGFGLGLSYVKAMVDAHHGTIHIESEPNKGSTFIIFLPKQQNIVKKEIN